MPPHQDDNGACLTPRSRMVLLAVFNPLEHRALHLHAESRDSSSLVVQRDRFHESGSALIT